MLPIALVALLALGLAIVFPAGLLLAAIIVLPLDPTYAVGATTITWSKIFIAIAAVRVVVDLVFFPERRKQFGSSLGIATAVFAGFVLWSALSVLWAHSHGSAIRETLKFAEYLTAFVGGAVLLRGARRSTLIVLMVWAMILSIASGAQFIKALHEGGLTSAVTIRAAGIFAGPNQASGYFEALAALGFSMLLSLRRPWRALQAISSIFPMIAIAATGSRGGLASIGAMGLSGILASIRSKRIVPLALGGALLAGALVAFAMFQPARLSAGLNVPAEISATTRLDLWKTALLMAKARPLAGVGAGNYPVDYPLYATPGPSYFFRTHANNLYLNLLAELGLVGLALFLMFFALLFREFAYRHKEDSKSPWHLVLLLLAIGALTHGLVDDLLVYPVDGIPLFALIGAAFASSKMEETRLNNWSIPVPVRVIAVLVLAFATPAAAYAARVSSALFVTAGFPSAALPFAKTAARLAPYEPSFRENVGQVEFANGNFDDAAGRLETSSSFDNLIMAGDARAKLHDLEGARVDWRRALALECKPGRDGWNYFQAELAATGRGLDVEATDCMRVAMDGDPLQPVNYEQSAAIAIQQHNYAKAETFIQRGLKIEPNDQNLNQLEAQIQIESGHRSEGARLVAQLSGRAKGIELARLGVSWYYAGDIKQARSLLDLAETTEPLSGQGALVRGLIAQQDGNATLADKFFSRKGAAFAAADRAQELLSGDNSTAAVPYLKIAAKYDPNNEHVLATIASVLLYKLGNASDAITFYNRALAQSVTNRDRAKLQAQRGDAEAAIGAWAASAKDDAASDAAFPDDVAALHAGNAYEHISQLSKAETYYRQAISLNPGDALGYELLVKLYMKENRLAEARSWLARGLKQAPENQALQQLFDTIH